MGATCIAGELQRISISHIWLGMKSERAAPLNPAPEERLFALFQMPLPPTPIFQARRAFVRSLGLEVNEDNEETK